MTGGERRRREQYIKDLRRDVNKKTRLEKIAELREELTHYPGNIVFIEAPNTLPKGKRVEDIFVNSSLEEIHHLEAITDEEYDRLYELNPIWWVADMKTDYLDE